MKTTAKRSRFRALFALTVGASIAVPIIAIATAGASSATTQDEVIFVQKSGQQKSGPYVEYEGANGTNLIQTITTGSGACSSATDSNPSPSVLPLTAAYYPKGYTSPSSPASVGSAVVGGVAETGVCVNARTSPGWTIQPDEGLIFSVGPNSLTAGRLFSEATIPLKNNSLFSSVSGTFVLRRMNSSGVEQTVDTVPFTLPPGGVESPGDTNDCPNTSTGVVPTTDQFDQLEIQVDSPSSGSVSVVGPNCDNDNDKDDQAVPTFYLDSAPAITSANATTFTAGTSGSFTVTSTGYPTPTLSDTSATGCSAVTSLPSGVTFTPNSNGTATIAGTPAAITTSPGTYTYNVCITASNDAGSAVQMFTLTVDQVPGFASANSTTFTSGSPGTFTVTTTGFPYPTLSDSSFTGCTTSLPSGVTFTPNSNGTATLAGTPAPITTNNPGGTYTYTVCLTASNAFGATTYSATQKLTLTVDQAPSITSATAATFTSGSSVAMTMGQAGSFTVTTTGNPAPAITNAAFGACTLSTPNLPSGVTLVDNGNGTATLSGTPADDTEGSYTLCLNATNSFGGSTYTATQEFTLTVDQAPAITSTNTDTVPAGAGFSFTVTTTGNPVPTTITDTCPGSLPADNTVSFTNNGNGTATISGTPAATDGGVYQVCINASNGVTPSATQTFTLTVDQAPSITSVDNLIVPVSQAFSFEVTTSGYPPPSLSDSAPVSGCTPNLPTDNSVTFMDNGNGTATISGTPASGDGGTWTICITATNGVTPAATQDFELVITSPSQPLTATNGSSDNVTASLQVNSGSKSFTNFTTSGSAGNESTVTFDTEGTSTYTATINIDWGDLPYCVPYASTTPPTCQPANVIITGSTSTPVLACPSGTPPAIPPLNTWCSEGASYSYVTLGGTEYTNIIETIYGSGDVTFNHG